MIFRFFKQLPLFNKIALICSIIAFILAIYNIFEKSEVVRAGIYVFVIICLIANFMSVCQQRDKFSKLYILKHREVMDLRWSYEQMGRYVKRMELPELSDIEIRIANELRDISVKQEYVAEQIGISKKEFKEFKEEGRL